MVMVLLARAVNLFSEVIVTLIIVSALMSWFTSSFGPGLWRVYRVIQSLTEPFLSPFRKLLWRFTSQMGIDFSPIVAILAVQFIARILIRVLVGLAQI